MEEAGFEAKPGQTLAVPTNGGLGAKAAVLVGLGPRDELTIDSVRNAAAAIARRCEEGEVGRHHAARRRAGRARRRPRWRRPSPRASSSAATSTCEYKSDGKPSKLTRVIVLGKGGAPVEGRARARPRGERGDDLGP